jgi:preprotein translocase SecE subunit
MAAQVGPDDGSAGVYFPVPELDNIMTVAVKNMPETSTRSDAMSLATSSVLGAVYVFAALGVVGFGVPKLWNASVGPWVTGTLGGMVSGACLIIIELVAIGILAFVGMMLTGGSMRHGLKAGIFSAVAWVLGAMVLTSIFGGTSSNPVWQGIGLAVGLITLFFGYRFFTNSKFDDRMRAFEDQGWFSSTPYKPNQGRKVRRGTILGLLVIAGAGIWTLLNHHTLDVISKDLTFSIPFTSRPVLNAAGAAVLDKSGAPVTQPLGITILPDVKYTLPILLILAALWLSYRIVHMPNFADFLIATEGELNKIAWPTKRSLWQDTMVVLTTVILMTLFLFVVDVAWGKILSHRWIGILQIPDKPQAAQVQETKELDWP